MNRREEIGRRNYVSGNPGSLVRRGNSVETALSPMSNDIDSADDNDGE